MTLDFGQADVTQLRLQRTRLRSEAEALEDALERQRAQARSAAREGAGFSGFCSGAHSVHPLSLRDALAKTWLAARRS